MSVLSLGLALATIVNTEVGILPVGFVVLCLFFFWTAVMGRLHDLNHNGLCSLLLLVPYLNFAFVIYLLLWPGTAGPNAYPYLGEVKQSPEEPAASQQQPPPKPSLSIKEQLRKELMRQHPYKSYLG